MWASSGWTDVQMFVCNIVQLYGRGVKLKLVISLRKNQGPLKHNTRILLPFGISLPQDDPVRHRPPDARNTGRAWLIFTKALV
jgi:hypothetical protein